MQNPKAPPSSDQSLNRRGFLRAGLAALAGIALVRPADAQRARRQMRRMRRMRRRAIRRMRRRGGVPDRARAAIRRGEIRPLRDVVAMVNRQTKDAEILDVDLHERQGRWIYGVRVLTARGRVRDVFVDGRTLDLLTFEPVGRGEGVPLPNDWQPQPSPPERAPKTRPPPRSPDPIPPPVRRPPR